MEIKMAFHLFEGLFSFLPAFIKYNDIYHKTLTVFIGKFDA